MRRSRGAQHLQYQHGCEPLRTDGADMLPVERAENQDLIGKFLSKHPEFRPYPVKRILNDISPHFSYLDDDQFFVQLLPYKDHVDGFFICKMEKL